MRVLITTDPLGGVWTYALELVGELVPRGVEVVLASLGGRLTRAQRDQVKGLPDVELFESAHRLIWMEDPWDDLESAGDWLLALEEACSPDVVHLNDLGHGALPWSRPTLMLGHSCVLSWWRAVHGAPAPPAYDRYRERVAAGLRRAELVVAPTRWMLASLVQHYGPLGRTRVIPNGRSSRGLRPERKEPFVLAAGRVWDAAKNLRTLGRAARGSTWPVLGAGPCSLPGGQPVDCPGVELLGTLAPRHVAALMARASILAHPARYEPFGLVPLEAALSGCALLLGDIESLRELWDGAALFVAPDDDQALAEALASLVRNSTSRRDLAALARARAARLHSRAMANAYASAYRELLAECDGTRAASEERQARGRGGR